MARSTAAIRVCPGAHKVADPATYNASLGADNYQCPPCHRGDTTPWLVTAGTCHAVIHAGCETAARLRMADMLRAGGRGRNRWQGHRTQEMTVRPATPADVNRWQQMLDQQETARG
jgi:hypothetical protein